MVYDHPRDKGQIRHSSRPIPQEPTMHHCLEAIALCVWILWRDCVANRKSCAVFGEEQSYRVIRVQHGTGRVYVADYVVGGGIVTIGGRGSWS